MLIEELLERLHDEAGLTNQTVTTRMLEDLVYERLVLGPTQIGGKWQWSEESLATALKVIEYRKQGFKRVTAIKSQWWLESGAFRVSEIRGPLISEYRRARNLLLRKISSIHGLRRDISLTEYRRTALRRQLGPLDPRFKSAGWDFGSAVVIACYEFARFGEQISETDKESERVASLLTKAKFPNGLHCCVGFLETDDTHPLSTVQALDLLTDAEFERCRESLHRVSAVFAFGQGLSALSGEKAKESFDGFDAIEKSCTRWPWQLAEFAFIANMYYLYNLSEEPENGEFVYKKPDTSCSMETTIPDILDGLLATIIGFPKSTEPTDRAASGSGEKSR